MIVINGLKFKRFIDRTEINSIILRLAGQINEDYRGKNVLFLVVMKGSMFTAADLLRLIEVDSEMETIRAKSYGMSLESSGMVELSEGKLNIKGRNVVIIEDIVDTGLTLKTLMEKLNREEPASLNALTLLSKTEKRKTDVYVKYIGREIPASFVIGYGLDFAEKGRNFPDIYIAEE